MCASAAVGVRAAAVAASRPSPRQASPAAAATAWADDVLLVTIDTLRADAVGFDGGPAGVTPTLDRLAAAGRVYPRTYAHAVLTLPSHTSLLTGLYPYQHGVRDNSGFRLGERVPTLATRLAAAGFATAAFVAAFPLDARFGLDRGFAVYDDRLPDGGESDVFALPERPGGEVVAAARAWWLQHAGERRFLWVHLFEPHSPYAPPEPFASRFPGHPYLGEVATADACLEPLLAPFLAGAEPPTLVVVTGDHGEALGDHGELTHGLFAYDSTLRVPLLLWGPGVAPGVDRRLARHVDVVPTVLAAVGMEAGMEAGTGSAVEAAAEPAVEAGATVAALPAGGELPGRSLLAPAAADTTSYFEALHAALNLGWAPLRGVVDAAASVKYVELPLPELYDLAADPRETSNRVDERRRQAGALDARLPREAPWPPAKGSVPSGDAAALAALGYLTGPAVAKRTYTAADDPKNLVDLDRRMQRMHFLFAAGRLDAAEAEVRSVLARRDDMAAAWSFLAQVLLQQGRYGDALAVMEDAARRGVASEALLRQQGLALAWLGRGPEAVALLTPLAAGGDPAALNALGTALVEAGQAERAIAVLRRVFDRDRDDARAHENLSLAYLSLGRWSDAAGEARRALDVDPGRAHAWNNLGVARYRLGDGAGALAAWRRCLELDPGQYDTLYNLGVKAAELGEPELARRSLARFVAQAPAVRYATDKDYAAALLARLGGAP